MNNDDEITKEQLIDALLDVTDGEDQFDLQAATGLPLERCEEIYRLCGKLWKQRDKRGW